MHSADSLVTIVFALVALAVIWKLRSVLGERTGSEKPPGDRLFGRNPPPANGNSPVSNDPATSNNVVRLPGAADAFARRPDGGAVVAIDRWRGYAAPGSAVAQGLDAIAGADPRFSASAFVEGAKIAYEAIVTAFATGERKTLQKLLAKDVYESFAAALNERAERGETVSTTIVSIDDARIEEAGLSERVARIVMRFESKMITTTHDAKGQVVDGDPGRTMDIKDVWSFARATTSNDPNWQLVATESGH
ncbi:MAG: Tim44/TimA family putative adaptor protein [Beijerinckiaceae bacterium]|nr:Tim44/TimA family putative adaptor protein [Beijerinckiaceae bacterium]